MMWNRYVHVARYFLVGLCVTCLCPFGLGQAPSTVQLPSFETFSYSGSVLVPDRGSAYLGGNKSAATSYRRRGPSHAYSSSLRNSNLSASVQIIDLDEIDRQILGGTPQEFVRRDKTTRLIEQSDVDAQGKALVRYARQKYADGDHSAAFDGYRMAIRVLSPRLRRLAEAEFRRVFGTAAIQSLGQR